MTKTTDKLEQLARLARIEARADNHRQAIEDLTVRVDRLIAELRRSISLNPEEMWGS